MKLHRSQNRLRKRVGLLGAAACAVLAGSCASDRKLPRDTVATAWSQRSAVDVEPPTSYIESPPSQTGLRRIGDGPGVAPIATVNGRPITRHFLTALLLRSHGVGLLEQLIGLETAVAAAEDRNLEVTEADLDSEYSRTLRRLVDPLSSLTAGSFDRRAAEGLLETVLRQRNVSREEFDILVRRNTYLGKIVEAERIVSEDQLRAEFRRVYGKRVRVRHIQLATLAEIQRVKERLTLGEDFGELAARYSANVQSAETKGLLDPFSAEDENIPAILREVSFTLERGEVSDAIRIGEWYHLVMLEKVLPVAEVDFRQVREALKQRLEERSLDAAMFDLFEKLFREATIEIDDPELAQAFAKKHPGMGR